MADFKETTKEVSEANTKSKMIEKLFIILTELDARESSFNCVTSELIGKSWDELCDDAIVLFNKLKA